MEQLIAFLSVLIETALEISECRPRGINAIYELCILTLEAPVKCSIYRSKCLLLSITSVKRRAKSRAPSSASFLGPDELRKRSRGSRAVDPSARYASMSDLRTNLLTRRRHSKGRLKVTLTSRACVSTNKGCSVPLGITVLLISRDAFKGDRGE